MKDILNPPRAASNVSHSFWTNNIMCPTSVNGRYGTLNNNHGKPIHSGQCIHNLLQSRKLGHHVKKHGNQRQERQVQRCGNTVTLSGPFSQDKTFWTLLPDDRSKICENHQWGRRRNGIDYHSLNPSDSCELRIREEDSRSESYCGQLPQVSGSCSYLGRGSISSFTVPTQALT